ncbi:hypothetical protein [Candidatus Coxiella mudrowiae]|nr:hypothetical protein [Candidatus Coxiella mudrowiae]
MNDTETAILAAQSSEGEGFLTLRSDLLKNTNGNDGVHCVG